MPHQWNKGDLIKNQYEVFQIIVKGGMGIVYVCYDHKNKSPLVLKTYKDDLYFSDEAIKLFEREARLWIELGHHPYIVCAYGVEKIEGNLFIILEYIAPTNGKNCLVDYLLELDYSDILKYAIQFCYGMEYAYSKQIKCHRDIKPDNIMIAQDKIVKITDFGLAKAFDELEIEETPFSSRRYKGFGVYKTKNGVRGGTLPFMAPEQFDGHTDVRSDIYSFGVVLYQMLNGGGLPFRGLSVAEYSKLHKFGKIPTLSSPLFSIIQNCMQKVPEARFQNFGILRQELEKLLLKETGAKFPCPEITKLEAREFYNKGLALVNLGKYEEAINCYNEAIAIDPKFAEAWANKGSALGNLNRYEEEIECYDKTIEINPKIVEAWFNKGVVLENLSRYKEAIDCLNEAIRLNPKFAEAWHKKGIYLGKDFSNFAESIECFDEAIRLNPKFAEAWSNKGSSLLNLGRNLEAIICFDEALIINPKNADTWSNKGCALVNLNRKIEAIKCFDEAIKINPKHAAFWFNKGLALANLGIYDEAINCYDEAIVINPKSADTLICKGAALRKLSRFEEAIECYNKVISINQKYAEAWCDKGLALGCLGRFKEGLMCVEQAIRLNPNYTMAYHIKQAILKELKE
jgi:tetratricopeptide (TPR) repeat protein